ncbi:MFS transporter [SAR202 cluster bacterium AD-802-E10_MRT_200m]|nr:MFS transporter [SAR202 cluster bacterium AD-802-E10_MRT_200m]
MAHSTDLERHSESRKSNNVLLQGALFFGHMGVHWFQQLWPVIIPSVKASLSLNNVEMGTLTSARQFTAGPLNLPSGFLADRYRKHTPIILACAFLAFGTSHFLVAQAPTFGWMTLCVVLLGVGTGLWHPAAIGSLSRRFPERRGSAIAIHGVGASVGDTVAPIAIGYLLLSIPWQRLLEFHVFPAVIVALILWKSLNSIFRSEASTQSSIGSYWSDIRILLSHPVVLTIIAVNILTRMASLSVMTFLPIYIQDDLQYSAFGLGFFWGLLHVMGALSQPIMGYLSDRLGRKFILLPALILYGILYLTLAAVETELQLILVIGALGLFFYALASLTMATVMDVASDRVQSTTQGINGVLTQFFSLPAPIVTGVIVTHYGTESAFVFSGFAVLLAAVLLALVHVPSHKGDHKAE